MKKLLMTLVLAMLCATQSNATDMTKLMEDARMDIVQPKLSAPAAKTFVYKSQKYNSLSDAESQMASVAATLKQLGYKVLEYSANMTGSMDYKFKIVYMGEQPLKTQSYTSSLTWVNPSDTRDLLAYRIKQLAADPNFKLLEKSAFLINFISSNYSIVYIGARQPKNKIFTSRLKYDRYTDAMQALETALGNMQDVTVTEAAVDMSSSDYRFKIAYID